MFFLCLRIALCTTLLGLFSGPAAAQEKDELWDVTTKVDMAGMPGAIPPMTNRMCAAKGAADDSFVPLQGECKVVDSKRNGNKYTFKMVCDVEPKMTMAGEITFGDGKYDGRMQMTGTADGKPMNMTQTYSGKRVGSCTAAAQPK